MSKKNITATDIADVIWVKIESKIRVSSINGQMLEMYANEGKILSVYEDFALSMGRVIHSRMSGVQGLPSGERLEKLEDGVHKILVSKMKAWKESQYV